jgi:hypothetical protein
MFNSDLTANRPAAGIVGRIFIAIDSPYGIFRDTGTAWDQISSAGGGATIYTGDGTLTGTRTISSGGFQLVFNPQTTFFSSLIPSTSASSFAVLGSNTLTFAAGFSSSNIGNVYSANGAINAQIFSGNATFAQANLASAMVNVNKIDFDSGGHTITMTQSTAPGIRAMTGVQNQIQFTGSHNGTISHAAISQNLGFFRESGSTRTLTITNAYSLLINPLDDYGSGFSFTNRWGIYQAGASDKNYFAANSLFGTTTDAGFRVDINGTARVSGNFSAAGNISFPTFSATGIGVNASGAFYFNLLGPGTGDQNLAIGNNARGLGNFAIAINNAQAQSGGIAISYTRADGGDFAAASAITFNGLVPISNVYFGSGKYRQNPDGSFTTGAGADYSINGSGASGTNLAGGNITISGGKGTGNSTSGDVIFATATPTTSGSTLQTLTSRWWVKGSTGTLSNVTTPDASAQVQINSTTQGFLPPRMTNAQRTAISSPAVGLIVYCTDAVEGLYIYKSTGWTFVI